MFGDLGMIYLSLGIGPWCSPRSSLPSAATGVVGIHPIYHNLSMCGRYRLSRRKQIIGEHFDSVSGDEDLESALQRGSDSAGPHHPKEPRRERSGYTPPHVLNTPVTSSLLLHRDR